MSFMLEQVRQRFSQLFAAGEKPTLQQVEARGIIDISKDFPKSIPSLLRLGELNPDNPFDPFYLGFVGSRFLDTLIMEQAAEARMEKNNSSLEVARIVKDHFALQVSIMSDGLGIKDPFLQAQCVAPLRSMASILLQTYWSVGSSTNIVNINVQSINESERKQAISICSSYANEYKTNILEFTASKTYLS